MSTPDGVDQSWSFLDPTYASQHGIRVVWDYLSHDPSKDWTAPQILAYHQAGVGCGFLWETDANRALGGYSTGRQDGRDAGNELTPLIGQVGYSPRTPIAVIAAIDFDTNPAQYAVINGYVQGFRDGLAGRAMTGAYGEADVLDELGPLIDVAFQTYAWSGGRLSARAALYQYLNGQTLDGASVDFDRIIDDSLIGAWWPPGHEPSGGGTPIIPVEEVDVSEYVMDDPRGGSWWVVNGYRAILQPELLNQLVADGVKHMTVVDAPQRLAQIDALPLTAVPSPGDAQILTALATLTAAVEAIPGGSSPSIPLTINLTGTATPEA